MCIRLVFSLPDLSQSGRREFRHVFASHNQQITSLRIDCGKSAFRQRPISISRCGGSNWVCSRRLVCLALCCALILGCCPSRRSLPSPKPRIDALASGLIIIPTSTTPEIQPQATPADAPFESSVDAALLELGRLADRYSVTVAFSTQLASFAAMDRALRKAGCPWFGIDLDPVSILRDRWEIADIFSVFGPFVRQVRGRDAVVGHDKRTQPAIVGKGNTHWRELLSLLDEAAYQGWIVVDPSDLPDRASGATAAHKHLETF